MRDSIFAARYNRWPQSVQKQVELSYFSHFHVEVTIFFWKLIDLSRSCEPHDGFWKMAAYTGGINAGHVTDFFDH